MFKNFVEGIVAAAFTSNMDVAVDSTPPRGALCRSTRQQRSNEVVSAIAKPMVLEKLKAKKVTHLDPPNLVCCCDCIVVSLVVQLLWNSARAFGSATLGFGFARRYVL